MKLKYSWEEVLEFVHLDIKCRYCFFIFFPFLDFLLVSKLNLNLLILPEVVFIRRTSQYGSFFSEWDFTQLGKWNYRKQKQVNDLQCKITNLFIWKNTWKKSDLAVIGRPFSSIQCIWWDHFLLSQMPLGQKYRLVKHSRDAQQGYTGVSFLQGR